VGVSPPAGTVVDGGRGTVVAGRGAVVLGVRPPTLEPPPVS
jgi:hypothetical protein